MRVKLLLPVLIPACALLALKVTVASAQSTTRPTTAPAAKIELADLKMTLISIESGEFLMGSPADEPSRHENELQHKVRITKPFYLQSTEVSQKQYKSLMGDNPSYFKGDDLPVENVSWDDAVKFCEKLSKREGRTFRLPTEAEWEYAARAGKPGPISGSGNLDEIAWHADNSGKQKIDSANIWDTDSDNYFSRLGDNGCQSRAVGTGTPNDWGIHDMQGNVCEWVSDWFAEEYYETGPREDPPGPDKSPVNSRAIRGGHWGADPRSCRVAHREWNKPDDASGSRGFRVAADAE